MLPNAMSFMARMEAGATSLGAGAWDDVSMVRFEGCMSRKNYSAQMYCKI